MTFFIYSRDEVNDSTLAASKAILVDHHVAMSVVNAKNIMEIIDHRPVSNALPPNAKCTIEEVGSCATLIADSILRSQKASEFSDILKFLYGPIVLDTVNFSVDADKFRPLDVNVTERIERLLNYDTANRNELFIDLVRARNDVSSLDSLQILSKDLKVISNNAKTTIVAIPGYPILVRVSSI